MLIGYACFIFYVISIGRISRKFVEYFVQGGNIMKNGKYGLDAPVVVIGYIAGGILFLILGIRQKMGKYFLQTK